LSLPVLLLAVAVAVVAAEPPSKSASKLNPLLQRKALGASRGLSI
jgi:hypothetical protein